MATRLVQSSTLPSDPVGIWHVNAFARGRLAGRAFIRTRCGNYDPTTEGLTHDRQNGWALSHYREARRGWNGGSLPGRGHASRAQSGDQVLAGPNARASGAAPALSE